ncbi:hypothetical protein BLNAU_15854 [Blattamonas nauphoetae]|uniref:Uncharacterized protein n=1 Tax=Blattamonas nauphoetae TaxID=2049346 RepID=A0ABQ9X9M5_9EUKA|nr:hypothetical protein BLNAU_15854 [Blattamonas nauphoetae]
MISSGDDPVYSPFLKWNPDDEISLDSFAHAFNSLVSLHVDDLLTAIGQDSTNPAAASALHQPTLNFICSSHIPMVFQSLLSKVEHENVQHFILWNISYHISKWENDGADTWCRGRILLQTLEQEGFRDHLEQTVLHDKSSMEGKYVGPSLFFSCTDRRFMDHHVPHRVVDWNLVFEWLRISSCGTARTSLNQPMHLVVVMTLVLPSLSNIGRLSSALHHSSNHRLRNEDLSLQGIPVAPITDGGSVTLVDIVLCARPDPGTDGLIHRRYPHDHAQMCRSGCGCWSVSKFWSFFVVCGCLTFRLRKSRPRRPSAFFATPTCSPTLIDPIDRGILPNFRLFDDGERVRPHLR